jgi:hypothetical protein
MVFGAVVVDMGSQFEGIGEGTPTTAHEGKSQFKTESAPSDPKVTKPTTQTPAGGAVPLMGSEIKQPALGPIPLAGARESSVSPGAQRLLKGARTIDEKVQQTQKDLVSDPTLLKTVLSEKEIISGRNNLNLAAASWGKATERLVANWSGGKGLFEHIGSGGSRKTVDFVGLGRFEGLKFDITAAGYKNYQTKLGKYGQMVIVPQYTRPIDFHLIFFK